MKKEKLKAIIVSLSLALLALPLTIAHGAGGRIEGQVTNPKSGRRSARHCCHRRRGPLQDRRPESGNLHSDDFRQGLWQRPARRCES